MSDPVNEIMNNEEHIDINPESYSEIAAISQELD